MSLTDNVIMLYVGKIIGWVITLFIFAGVYSYLLKVQFLDWRVILAFAIVWGVLITFFKTHADGWIEKLDKKEEELENLKGEA